MRIAVVLLILVVLAQGLTLGFLTKARDLSVENDRALLKAYAELADIQAAQARKLVDQEVRIEELELQLDLVSAATRTSWADAYRVLRGLERP